MPCTNFDRGPDAESITPTAMTTALTMIATWIISWRTPDTAA